MLPFIKLGNRLLPMYGLCMTLGFAAAVLVSYLRSRRRGVDKYDFIVVAACGMGLGLMGTRVLYLIASYGVRQIIADIGAGDWSFLMEGGQVYLGGLIGGVLGGMLGARIMKGSIPEYCDIIIPTIPLGHAFGRVGCHFAGCCYGMPYEGFCSVTYPLAGVDYGVFPVQLMEAAVNIVIFVIMLLFMRKPRRRFAVLWMYMLMYAVARFTLEFFRGDAIRGAAAGLSTSQWISVAMFAAAVVMLVAPALRKRSNIA